MRNYADMHNWLAGGVLSGLRSDWGLDASGLGFNYEDYHTSDSFVKLS
jgi:hypothetical protein